jgi:hypothetical protein
VVLILAATSNSFFATNPLVQNGSELLSNFAEPTIASVDIVAKRKPMKRKAGKDSSA